MKRRAFLMALPAATVGLAAGVGHSLSSSRSAGAARSVAPVVAGRLPLGLDPEDFSRFLREVVHLRVLDGTLGAPWEPWRTLCGAADDRHQERDPVILRRIAQGCGVPYAVLVGR